MKDFLLEFTHEIYHGGWETVTEQRLVRAEDYTKARIKLMTCYEGARDIKNLTIE